MQMVLNVLWCAGAVPLRPHQDFESVPTVSTSTSTTTVVPSSAALENVEYVQFLEQLVGELSNVFAHWVHENPPVSAQDVDDMYRRHCSPGSPLPDLIPSADSKWQSSPCRDLRVRRGLEPMTRIRLDSVGSSIGSTASSEATTPSSPVSPMNLDLITPSSSTSTASFYPSSPVADHFYYPPSPPATTLTAAPLASEWPATEAADAADDVADGSDCSAEWRRVGRELRSIADTFATSRPPTQNLTSSWSLVGNGLLSTLSPLASPLVSALAVYFWWKVVRRLA